MLMQSRFNDSDLWLADSREREEQRHRRQCSRIITEDGNTGRDLGVLRSLAHSAHCTLVNTEW